MLPNVWVLVTARFDPTLGRLILGHDGYETNTIHYYWRKEWDVAAKRESVMDWNRVMGLGGRPHEAGEDPDETMIGIVGDAFLFGSGQVDVSEFALGRPLLPAPVAPKFFNNPFDHEPPEFVDVDWLFYPLREEANYDGNFVILLFSNTVVSEGKNSSLICTVLFSYC